MVEAAGTGNPINNVPRAPPMADDSEGAAGRLQWTASLVTNVDKRLRASVSVDELKKLCINNAMTEFKKVLQ